MEKVKVSEVCKISNGFAFKSDKYVSSDGGRVIRITNVQKGIIVDNDPKLYPFSELKNLENYKINEGDIMMSLTGNVGRVGKFPKELLPAYINQRVCRIKSNSKNLLDDYLYHFLNSDKFENDAVRNSAGAAQLNLSTNWLADYEIPLPSLQTQQKIAAILDKADELRQYNKQLIAKYDALTQSLFLDMFGDPVRNEKGWDKKKLGELGEFKNGLNYSKSENGKSIKIIGISDFKDFWEISNYANLSIIEIENFPSDGFLLKNGDFLFVRSNGNKELVGRCIIVNPNEEKVTYSGFCIRFRKNTFNLNEIYFVQLMRNKSFKKYIFKNGRGANIQNINQELLTNIEIQLPPIELQNQFAEQVQFIETQKQKAEEVMAKSEALFQGLLQQAFNGELN